MALPTQPVQIPHFHPPADDYHATLFHQGRARRQAKERGISHIALKDMDRPVIQSARRLSDIKLKRAGVIPFTIHPETGVWYLLARDGLTGDLGDFGGGCKKGERAIDTAMRELHEESRRIFSPLFTRDSHFYLSLALCSRDMGIVFAFLPVEWMNSASPAFEAAILSPKSQKTGPEVSGIEWVSHDDLVHMIQDGAYRTSDFRSKSNEHDGRSGRILWELVATFLHLSDEFSRGRKPFVDV